MKHSENGFTLVELLVAISIFAIVMATVIQGITYNAQVNNMTEARGEAVVVTRQVLDDYRGRTSLPSSGTETMQVTKGRTYSVVTRFCPPLASGGADPLCVGGRTHLRVEVSYNNRRLLSTDTVYTPVSSSTTLGSGI